jgi:hypothetical protein
VSQSRHRWNTSEYSNITATLCRKEIFLPSGSGFQPRVSQQDAAPTAINWENITAVLIIIAKRKAGFIAR